MTANLVAASTGEVTGALRSAGAINSLFTVRTGHCTGVGVGDPWQPAATLCRAGDPHVAQQAVTAVGDWLGTAERRVAASMTVLGYSTRLVAPAMAAMLCSKILLDLHPQEVWWRYTTAEGFRLCLPTPSGWRAPDGAADRTPLLDHWARHTVDNHLRPFIATVRRTTPVAVGLLWGNVASSLAGTLRMLALTGTVPLPACHTTGEMLLGWGPLRGSGSLVPFGGQLFFVRRSCCLYYRLPRGGMCSDCALVAPADRERQWASAVHAGPHRGQFR